MTARETNIVKTIVEGLRKHAAHRGQAIVVRKRHGSVMGHAGDPDIYGILDGRHFELEVKRPGEEPTPLQRYRLEEWRGAGAIAGWVTDVDQAKRVLWPDEVLERKPCTPEKNSKRPRRK